LNLGVEQRVVTRVSGAFFRLNSMVGEAAGVENAPRGQVF